VRAYVDRLLTVTRESVSPLARLEPLLHPWVAFAIMPIFALANAGVALRTDSMFDPLAIAIAAGLVLGKTIGVTGAAFLSVRSGAASLPKGVTWPIVAAGALLSGIGFTMSLFIASLGLEGPMLETAKTGILLGSLVAGSGGFLALSRLLPRADGGTLAGVTTEGPRAG
jgi:NhaA family Na+:H+ antiporter